MLLERERHSSLALVLSPQLRYGNHFLDAERQRTGRPALLGHRKHQTCTEFSVSAFDATFNWELGGGNLDIKQNHAADDVTLALWDTTVGATLVPMLSGGPFINITGNLVDMVTVPASAVPGTYATTTSFDFATPYTIQAGHSYIATLTSSTPSKSAAYKIKQIAAVSIQDANGNPLSDSPAPEPSTWAMMAGGLALALVSARKRTRPAA